MPKRILIVEDEPVTRKNISRFLRELGYYVDEAKDGAEALDLLNTSRFDLLLSDVRMPRVDGMIVSSYLRCTSPNTPVIIITGYPDEMVGAFQAPRVVRMSKPVLLDDLESKIRQLLQP
jgi:CheY-like chemotaxis protein